jgi:hypothetical protein
MAIPTRPPSCVYQAMLLADVSNDVGLTLAPGLLHYRMQPDCAASGEQHDQQVAYEKQEPSFRKVRNQFKSVDWA